MSEPKPSARDSVPSSSQKPLEEHLKYPGSQRGPKNYQLRGCLAGGCFLPMALFVLFLALGDIGGPLIWPIFSIAFGIIGWLIGLIVGFIVNRTRR